MIAKINNCLDGSTIPKTIFKCKKLQPLNHFTFIPLVPFDSFIITQLFLILIILSFILLLDTSQLQMRFQSSVMSYLWIFFVSVLVVCQKMHTMADDNSSGGDGGGLFGELSESCNADLSSFLPPPYSNMSNVVCKPVWNTYLLRYSQTQDHVLTIILSTFYTNGWVGMGFSRDGMMVGSSAMVGWLNKHGHARIKQFYLKGAKSSQVIANKGELPLTSIPPVVVLNGATFYMAFQLKFANSLAIQPILLAFGTSYPVNNRLLKHDDKTTIMFNFAQGSSKKKPEDLGKMKRAHGILGVVGWGIILPCGAIVARYLKHKDPLWYYLHTIIQFSGFLIILANVVIGRGLYNKISANQPTHRGIGIFALVLVILQILAFFLRPNKETKIRKYWNWYHHWFGRLALFFGALNIVLGIQIGLEGTDWKIGYGFLLAVVLVTVIVLEVLKSLQHSEKTMHPVPSQIR